MLNNVRYVRLRVFGQKFGIYIFLWATEPKNLKVLNYLFSQHYEKNGFESNNQLLMKNIKTKFLLLLVTIRDQVFSCIEGCHCSFKKQNSPFATGR